FSSSRLDTRSKRDWSSDVCSSDLGNVCRLKRDVKLQLINFKKQDSRFILSLVFSISVMASLFSSQMLPLDQFCAFRVHFNRDRDSLGQFCHFRMNFNRDRSSLEDRKSTRL